MITYVKERRHDAIRTERSARAYIARSPANFIFDNEKTCLESSRGAFGTYQGCTGYCLNKNLNASRPSERPPVRGENVKKIGRIAGCKYKTCKRVPRWQYHWVNSIISGRNPPLCCLYTYINRHAGTLIAMQGHHTKRNTSDDTLEHGSSE